VQAALGVDLVEAMVARAAGATATLGPTHRQHASIRFLLAPGDGVITTIDGVDQARAEPGVCDIALTATAGDSVTLTGSFTDRLGSVTATGRSRADAGRHADTALSQLSVAL
jgi:argininosuccinate lyase